jgi:hypothetical protein
VAVIEFATWVDARASKLFGVAELLYCGSRPETRLALAAWGWHVGIETLLVEVDGNAAFWYLICLW